jgi:hypothetical protein
LIAFNFVAFSSIKTGWIPGNGNDARRFSWCYKQLADHDSSSFGFATTYPPLDIFYRYVVVVPVQASSLIGSPTDPITFKEVN